MLTKRVRQSFLRVVIAGFCVVSIFSVAQAQKTTATTKPGAENVKIMSAIPSEAWAAVLFKDMVKTSQDVDAYSGKLGFGEVGLQRQLSRMIGVSGQIDMASPMALVVMSKDKYGDEPVALIVSVKEYEKFAADLKSKTTETPGLLQGEHAELGDVFFGKKGGYLVMGPTEAIVKNIIVCKNNFYASMSPSALNLMAKSDVYGRVNFNSLGQFLKPTLMGLGAMMQMGAMGGMAGMGDDATPEENAKAMAQMQAMQSAGVMINAVVGFLDETESFDLGLTLDEKDIQAGFMFGFKPGSELANCLAAQKQSDDSLVRGVTGKDFVFAGGFAWQSQMTKLMQAIMQINPGFADPADFEKYKTLQTEILKMNLGQSMMVSMAKAQIGEPMFAWQLVTETTDAKKFIELTRQLADLQIKGLADNKNLGMKFEQGVATVNGVAVDRYTMDMNSILTAPGMAEAGMGDQMAQIMSLLKMVLGAPDGKVSFLIAPATDKRVVSYFGADKNGMVNLIKSAKADTKPLVTNAKVKAASKLLPAKRVAEGYLDLGSLASGAMAIAMGASANGSEKPTTLPAIKTPLVASSVSVEGSAVTMDVVVPFEVVQNLMNLRYMVPTGAPAVK